jgi:hypothetical protein
MAGHEAALKQAGFTVLFTETLNEAWACYNAEHDRIELLIVDLMAPIPRRPIKGFDIARMAHGRREHTEDRLDEQRRLRLSRGTAEVAGRHHVSRKGPFSPKRVSCRCGRSTQVSRGTDAASLGRRVDRVMHRTGLEKQCCQC